MMELENLVVDAAVGHKISGDLILKVEVQSINEEKVRFLLKGVDVAFANALRRTMIMDVPCMVIDDIFVFENSSVVMDESLAHRIGLVPLKTDLENYILPSECECKSELGCEKCRVVLTLDMEAETDTRTVYSGDFISENSAVVPASPTIPLTKIAPGQAVRLEAYARLGTGREHSKWQPVSESIYQNQAEIIIHDNCNNCAECVKACPRDVFTLESGELKIVDINQCILCSECERVCPVQPQAVTVGIVEDTYVFSVESAGGLSPEKIVTEAVKVLSSKLSEFAGKIERGETQDEISDFEMPEQVGGRLYSVGSGDDDNDEEELGYDE
jgi:DNA-directed RNA polymerase subunit D